MTRLVCCCLIRRSAPTSPPKAHPTQFRRILDALDNVKPGGETDVGAVLHEAAERVKRRGLVIVISDLIDDEAKIASGLQHFGTTTTKCCVSTRWTMRS